MPKNFDALLRYHTIDECLQNRFRKWTLEDLADKCSDALLNVNYRPSKNRVSTRTIEQDIKVMRGNDLGYNAPIKVKNGEYYYEEKDFSIRNATISKQDIQNLSAAITMFKTYKGLEFFSEVENLLNRLEKKVHVKTYQEVQKIISFEQIPSSGGQDWINPLRDAILNKQVISLCYKKFNSNEEKKYIYHPYLLKEYRNRWYVLGWYDEGKYIKTFALDRLIGFEIVSDLEYIETYKPDPEAYFKNTIGVTLNDAAPEFIELKFTGSQIPYVKSQPLHGSQEIINESSDSVTIQLKLTLNYELESLISSFAHEVEVIKPLSLRNHIKEKVKAAYQNVYSDLFSIH